MGISADAITTGLIVLMISIVIVVVAVIVKVYKNKESKR